MHEKWWVVCLLVAVNAAAVFGQRLGGELSLNETSPVFIGGAFSEDFVGLSSEVLFELYFNMASFGVYWKDIGKINLITKQQMEEVEKDWRKFVCFRQGYSPCCCEVLVDHFPERFTFESLNEMDRDIVLLSPSEVRIYEPVLLVKALQRIPLPTGFSAVDRLPEEMDKRVLLVQEQVKELKENTLTFHGAIFPLFYLLRIVICFLVEAPEKKPVFLRTSEQRKKRKYRSLSLFSLFPRKVVRVREGHKEV